MTDASRRLDGSRIAGEIRDEVKGEVDRLRLQGVVPRLDAVLVGDDPASSIYVASKARTCESLGLASQTHELAADTSETELLDLVDRLNADPEMLRREGVDPAGRRAVVVGRSDIVGKPMAMLLLHANATVTLCHSRTSDLAATTRQAEILVVAAGRLALIGPDHVADGAVVVDVGMHRVTDAAEVDRLFSGNPRKLATFSKKGAVLAGDVDFEAVAGKAGRITPVPGGVGPLTIAMLMANTVRAARSRRGV